MPVAALTKGAPALTMTVPEGLTVGVTRRAGDTSKTVLLTVNKSQAVTINGQAVA